MGALCSPGTAPELTRTGTLAFADAACMDQDDNTLPFAEPAAGGGPDIPVVSLTTPLDRAVGTGAPVTGADASAGTGTCTGAGSGTGTGAGTGTCAGTCAGTGTCADASRVPEPAPNDRATRKRLLTCAQQGRAEEVAALLHSVAAGTLAPFPEKHERAALRLAALNDHAPVLEAILGATAPDRRRNLLRHVTDYGELLGWSALEVATLAGSLQGVCVLLHYGADARASHVPSWDSVPLCIAARTWHYNFAVVETLWSAGAGTDCYERALDFAVRQNRMCMVRLMVRDVKLVTWRNFEAAARYGSPEVIETVFRSIRWIRGTSFARAMENAVDNGAAAVETVLRLASDQAVEDVGLNAEIPNLVQRAVAGARKCPNGEDDAVQMLRTLISAKAQPLRQPLRTTLPEDSPQITDMLVRHARAFDATYQEEDAVDALSYAAELGSRRVAAWIVEFYDVHKDDALLVAIRDLLV